MDEVITITDEDVDTEKNSRSRLTVGTELTRGELLHLALMSSENRAAHALGRTGRAEPLRVADERAPSSWA
jgi:D-alanyl-D-alanine endopeptidase (penicillin-binding protein 7)